MMKIEHPKNVSVDFERYQKKFTEADCLIIDTNLVTVVDGNTVHMYNFSKINSLDYDIPSGKKFQG